MGGIYKNNKAKEKTTAKFKWYIDLNSINLGRNEDFHVASSDLDWPMGCKIENERWKRIESTNLVSIVILNKTDDRKNK